MLVHLAGAASFSPPSLHPCFPPPSLPLTLSLSLFPCSTTVHTPLSLCLRFFFPPLLIRSVSQRRQLGEAAVCASALQLPQVKTAASSDVANPTGGGGLGSLWCCGCKFSSQRGAHISNHIQESILEGRTDAEQRIPATRLTNHRLTRKSTGFQGLRGEKKHL